MTVPPLDPKLWSQERDFPRDAAATGGGAPIASSPSTFERIIRYAERDDLLLYATALFGILMPGLMFLLYRAIHSRYHAYAKREREKRRRARFRDRTVTLFYASADRALKKFVYDTAEQLIGVDAAVVALVPEHLSMFYNYKGTAVFVLPNINPELLSDVDLWLFDWLAEMRYEAREKSLLVGMRFAIITIAAPDAAPPPSIEPLQQAADSEIATLLSKRLIALDARQLQPPVLLANDKAELELQPKRQADRLVESLRLLLGETGNGYHSDDTELLSTESEPSDDEDSIHKKIN